MELDSQLQEWLENPPVPEVNLSGSWIVYGAGNCGRRSRRVLEQHGAEVLAFLDQKAAEGAEVDGLPCLNPRAALDFPPGTRCLVAVYNFTVPLAPIWELLKGHPNITPVTYFDWYATVAGGVDGAYWLADRGRYRGWKPEIRRAHAALADERSREVYAAALRLRLGGVWRDLEALHEPDQYFAAGIPSPASIRMLDGGACEGDAVRNALTSGGKVERVWCFEPDARNFIALSEWLKAQDGIGEAEVWPCGLWNRSGVLRFSGGTGASSHLDPAGEERVSVVALDETFPVPPPINLVKLDIEGAEAKALNGMKNLLAERRPHLAVCVYHKPEDLWAILLQIEAMVPNYRFYLRSHAYNGFDLVLYGVPS